MRLASIASVVFGFGFLLSQEAVAVSAEPDGDYAAGKVTLHFDGHGGLQVRQGDNVKVTGRYAIAGDEMTLTDESGPWACESAQARGMYRWTLANDTLTFKVIKDSCAGRSGDLARAWTHSK